MFEVQALFESGRVKGHAIICKISCCIAYENDILFTNIFSSVQLLHSSIAFVLSYLAELLCENNGNLLVSTLISRTCEELNA
jgi:hypothetical protein